MLAILAGVVSAVVAVHYWALLQAARGIRAPVAVTAGQVRLHTEGRGGTYASVTYVTDQGLRAARLPQLGHDAGSYRQPVRLVYDAAHPTRALLASDWRDGRSSRAEIGLWTPLAVFVAAASWIVRELISLVRLVRRSGRS